MKKLLLLLTFLTILAAPQAALAAAPDTAVVSSSICRTLGINAYQYKEAITQLRLEIDRNEIALVNANQKARALTNEYIKAKRVTKKLLDRGTVWVILNKETVKRAVEREKLAEERSLAQGAVVRGLASELAQKSTQMKALNQGLAGVKQEIRRNNC